MSVLLIFFVFVGISPRVDFEFPARPLLFITDENEAVHAGFSVRQNRTYKNRLIFSVGRRNQIWPI